VKPVTVPPAQPDTPSRPAPDPFQQRVIDAAEASIRVVAPAGSGKTETLARRVEQRIADGIPAHRILVLTFDRNAAASFRAKLHTASGPAPRVETLNAWGYALLRQHINEDRTRIITEPFWPGTRYLSDLVNDYGLQVFSSMLSKIKNEILDPRTTERKDLASWIAKNKIHLLRDLENEQIVARISDRQFGNDLASEYIAYERFLQDRGGIDFDDQKLRPLIHLRKNRDLRERIQGMVDEVIVDEFQDINHLDCELIALISPKATLVVTGDDDQAIYGFRGASAGFLIDPAAAFGREFTHYELSVNYRCPERIIDVAGRLIGHNETRIAKSPRADKDLPGRIDTLIADNVWHEAARIARYAGAILHSDDPKTMAVLTRTNGQAIDIQSAMIRAATPYQIAPENDIRITWEHARKMLLLAPTLREHDVPPPEDRATIVRAFAATRRLPERQVNNLVRAATQEDYMFPGPALQQLLPDRFQAAFTAGISQLRHSRSLGSDIIALEDFLNAVVSRAIEGGRRANQLSRLAGLEKLAEDDGDRREEFLVELDRLISIQREALRRSSTPKITLSTCHGAKGREWQVVFVPQCNDGVFPDNRSVEGEYLEAERKLFYVSITRAAERLVVSWVDDKKNGRSESTPSRFLIEAGLAKPPKQKSLPQEKNGRRGGLERAQKPSSGVPNAHPMTSRSANTGTSTSATRPKRRISLMSARRRKTIDGLADAAVAELGAQMLGWDERGEQPLADMTIRYQPSDPDATFPLQLDLALRGIPFQIDAADRVTESDIFTAMQEAWRSGVERISGSADADTIAAMERVLARVTESPDPARWRTLLTRLEDDAPGTDPSGVQFLAS